MSRRHSQDRSLAPALEADPEAVGHLATLDDVPGDASRPALPWWFATPMPEPWDTYLWHQWPSAWAEITLRVCGSVWRTTGARMYAVHRDSELRADLYDWLIVTAVENQAHFTPRPGHPAPEANWGAFLRERLTEAARWHFGRVVGSSQTANGRAAIDAHDQGIRSVEHLDELQAETGATYTRHPLHGDDLFSRDPARILIRIEDLDTRVEQLERDNVLSGTYSTSSTVVGQTCLTLGCDRPSKARGLCHRHYQRERRQQAALCKVDGCTTGVAARGMCSTHYEQHKARAVADGTWTPYDTPAGCSVDGCPSTTVEARGLCPRHYDQWRRDNAPPCNIDGCTKKANGSRGMCAAHYERQRRASKKESA